MKLYNYAIRTYRVFIIRRFFKLFLTTIFFLFEMIIVAPEILKNKTVGGFLFDAGVFGVVIVAFTHNIIETIKLILDLREGPQNRSMRFIKGTWDSINVYDRKWYWGWIQFRYSAAYVKGKNYRKYIKLRGTFSREKWDKINRMSSPRFEVVYFPRSKIMKELR